MSYKINFNPNGKFVVYPSDHQSGDMKFNPETLSEAVELCSFLNGGAKPESNQTDNPLPAKYKPGFLGLVEVVGNQTDHPAKIGSIGPIFHPKHDPTGRDWSVNELPDTFFIMLDENGDSFFIDPSDCKKI